VSGRANDEKFNSRIKNCFFASFWWEESTKQEKVFFFCCASDFFFPPLASCYTNGSIEEKGDLILKKIALI
jgi:hypothetical protein